MAIDFGAINYMAVVAGVVISMIGGALWYSPLLWAKPWMAATGITQEYIESNKSGAYVGYAVSIAGSFVLSLSMAIFIQLSGASSTLHGLIIGLIAGIGFVATTQASSYTFESRPMKLYLINIGYPIVMFAIIGIVLAAWS